MIAVQESKRSIFEIFGMILLNPRETFGYIIAKKSGLEEALIFLIYALSIFAKYAMLYIALSQNSFIYSWLRAISLDFTKFTLVFTFVAFITLFLSAGVAHFLAKSAKGIGEFREAVTLFTFSSVANAVVIIGAGFSLSLPSPIDLGVVLFSLIIYLVWKAFLFMLAVEEVYGIGESEAFIAGVVGPLILGVLIW